MPDIECAKVVNMLRYSHNNIIIIIATNVIILQFFSARFVHPGAPQLFLFFLT